MSSSFVQMERRAGIPSNKIIVGGFSQGAKSIAPPFTQHIYQWYLELTFPPKTGAALALYCALHYPEPLAGCIALSTFFPEAKLPKPGELTNKGEQILRSFWFGSFCVNSAPFQIFHFSKLMGRWTQSYHSRWLLLHILLQYKSSWMVIFSMG